MSGVAFLDEIEALRAAEPTGGLVSLDDVGERLRKFTDSLAYDDPTADRLWTAWSAMQRHLEGVQLLARPDAVTEAVKKRRSDLVVRIGNDDAFDAAFEQAMWQVALPYYDTRADWFFAAATLSTTSERRARVVTAYAAALQQLVEERMAGGDLVNSVALNALGRALVGLQPVEAVAALEVALRFCIDRKCHYEAMQAAGSLALALASASASAEAGGEAMRAFLHRWQNIYRGERFVMEVQYALWMLDDDAAAARAFLADSSNTKGLALVAATLADLDDKAAIEVLHARALTLKNPVTREAFDEALHRLRTQTSRPQQQARMVHLFGVLSSTEQALGEDSDDVFVQRARARTANRELGQVIETDNSADED